MKKTGLAIPTVELIAFATLHAQAPTGVIAGRITDPTGTAIPGARILVTNKQTAAQRALVTTNEGDYSAAALLAGVYEVTAEAPGFQRLAREAIIEAGSATTVNLAMQLGATKDTITVFGFALGGPVRRDRLFFFGNWERNEQCGVVDMSPSTMREPTGTRVYHCVELRRKSHRGVRIRFKSRLFSQMRWEKDLARM